MIPMPVVFFAILYELGGFSSANNMIHALDPSLLSVWGKGMGFEGQWGVVAGAIMIFSVGYLGWPHVVTLRNWFFQDKILMRNKSSFNKESMGNICWIQKL